MKIIHILAGKANPNTLNGVNKVVHELATHQVLAGYEVFVVGIASNTQQRHTPIYNYKLFKKHKLKFCYNKEVLNYLLENSNKETIFHFHSVFIPWFLPLIKKIRKDNKFHIFLTPHGQYTEAAMQHSLKKRLFFHIFDSRLLKLVEAVHIIGYNTEDNRYINNYARRKAIIPNGFNTTNIECNYSNRKLIISYLGRIECKQKGLDILIKAFAQYKEKKGRAKLHIAGAGPDKDKLKKMVNRYNLSDCIIFKGKIFDENKWAFLKESAAFISPSHWDGLPTASLEAAAAHLPLIISEATNLGKFVNKYNCGLILKEVTIDNIEKALFDFEYIYFSKQEYIQMCQSSAQMINEELNWVYITNQIIDTLYKSQQENE